MNRLSLLVCAALVGCTTNDGPGKKVDDDSGSTTTLTSPDGWRTVDTRIDGADGPVDSDGVQMCFLAGGALVVAWADARDGNRGIWAIASADGGKNWPEVATKVSDATATADHPHMACSGDAAFLAWEDQRDSENEASNIYFARTIDAGLTWGPNIRLVGGDENVYNRLEPRVAADGTNVHVVWSTDENGAPDIFVASSTSKGASFGEPMRLDGDVDGAAWSNHPIAFASGTKATIAWEDRRSGINGIYVATSGDAGASFGAPVQVDGGVGDSFDPVIAAAGTEAYVLWHQAEPALEVYSVWSTDGGGTWGAPVRLSEGVPGERDSILPQAVLAGGVLHTVWFQGLNGGYHVVYKQVSGGAPTGGQLRLDHAPDLAQTIYPVLAVSGANVVVGWRDDRNATLIDHDDLFYAYSVDGGATWSPNDQRIDSHPDGNSPTQDLNLAVDASALTATWSDGRNGSSDVFFIHLALGSESE